MKVIKEVICTKCRKKQVTGLEDLIDHNLFWRTCEFCKRFGLRLIVRQRLTVRERMEAFYRLMGLRITEMEAFLRRR
jgi:hypothetical protein